MSSENPAANDSAKIKLNDISPSCMRPESKNAVIAKAAIAPKTGRDRVNHEFRSWSGILPLIELLTLVIMPLTVPPIAPRINIDNNRNGLLIAICPEKFIKIKILKTINKEARGTSISN